MSNSEASKSNRKEKCFSLWLGIAAADCPPNHYRLLDLPLFEDSPEQIRMATHRRLAHISAYNSAEDVADAAALRNYIAKVSAGLLDPKQKRFYDEELRKRLSTPIAHEAHSSPPPHYDHAAKPAAVLPTVSVPVVAADAPRLTPSAKGSVWPWVAGIATLNTLALAGIVVALLLWNRTPPAIVLDQAKDEPKQDQRPLADSKALPEPKTFSAEPPKSKIEALAISSPHPAAAVLKDKSNATGEVSKSESKLAEDDDADKSQATPKQNLPAPKKKKKKSDDPFEDVANVVQLPEMPSGTLASSELISLGKVDPSLIDGISLQLDAQAADLPNGATLGLEKPTNVGDHNRLWQIQISGKGGSDIKLGQFQFSPSGELGFSWRLSDRFSKAGQLRNSVLLLQHGSSRKEIFLRQSLNTACGAFDLSQPLNRIPLQIEDPPKDQTLAIVLKELRGTNTPDLLKTNTPITLSADADKFLAYQDLITIGGELEQKPDGEGFTLLMRAKYSEGKKWPPLKFKDLNSSTRVLLKDIRKNAADYANAIYNLPGVLDDIDRKNAEKATLNIGIPAQAKRNGDLSLQLKKLNDTKRSLSATIDTHRKSLPKSYRALARKMEIGQFAVDLQDKGQLVFEVVSHTDARDIILVQANGEPQKKPARLEFDLGVDTNIAGPWINLEEDAVYTLDAGGSFHMKSLKNPVAGQGGMWTQSGENVELRGAGLSVPYKNLHNIELRHENTYSLFRLL
jgi:hypothetical protein